MGLLVALVVAQPFVRSMTGTHEGAACLWWPVKAIEFRQATQGNPATGAATSLTAISNAFITWNDAMKCSSLYVTEGAKVATRKVGATPAGPNTNLVLFRTRACSKVVPATHACWRDGTCANTYDCWDQSAALLATTTVTYDSVTGAIFDADIEFNAADHVFTAVDSPVCVDGAISQRCVATDIQNTATHEIGHFLGLGHTAARGSTMNDSSVMGERTKRSLDEGSRAFLCQAYSPEAGPDDCVLPPVSEVLGAPATGCTTTPGLGLLALALLPLVRRRSATFAALLLSGVSVASAVDAVGPVELAQKADRVAHVRVSSVHARWAHDSGRIVTDVALEVHETWKGTPSARLEVIVPGGVVGRIGQRVSGAPRLSVGDELIVFLEARGDRFVLTGLSQGVFRILRTDSGALVSQPGSSPGASAIAPMPLDRFRAAIARVPPQGADSNFALPAALPTQISR